MRKTLWLIVFGLILSVMTVLPAFSKGVEPKEAAEELPVYKIRVLEYAQVIDDLEGIKRDRVKKFLEEKFSLEIEWLTGFSDNYAQLLTTSMAAADTPELSMTSLFWLSDPTSWDKWVAEDLLVDMGEYVYGQPERYSNLKLAFDHPYYKMYNEHINGDSEKYVAWWSATFDSVNQTGIVFNGKMMKELNIKMPETVDELIAALRKVKREKDIPGLAWVETRGTDWSQLGWWFFDTYGSHIDGFWQKPDGTWYDAAIAPENKALWKQLQGLYSEGLLNPKWLTTDRYAWIKTDFMADKLFCGGLWAPHPHSYNHYFNNVYKIKYPDAVPEEDFPLNPKPLKGPKGDMPVQAQIPFAVRYNWFIPYNTKYPDRILDLMNYLASDEGVALNNYGVKGIHYTKDDFSDFNLEEFLKDTVMYTPASPDRSQYTHFFNFIDWQQHHSPFVEIGDWVEGILRGGRTPIPFKNRAGIENPAVEYATPIHDYALKVSTLNRPVYFDIIGYTDEEKAIQKKCKDYRNEWFTKFLLGERDVDKEWDAFVQGYRALGADEIATAYAEKLFDAKAMLDRYSK